MPVSVQTSTGKMAPPHSSKRVKKKKTPKRICPSAYENGLTMKKRASECLMLSHY
jgi:hypothetical protein